MLIIKYVGVAQLLYATPVWLSYYLSFLIFFESLNFLRDYTEGLPYNVSWSSRAGVGGVLAVIYCGQSIMQQQQVDYAPLYDTTIQMICLVVCFIPGLLGLFEAMGRARKRQTAADTFHNIVIVFLLLFGLTMTLPIVWIAGSVFEKSCTIAAAVIWIGTFIFDVRTGRTSQTKWLQERIPTIGWLYKKK